MSDCPMLISNKLHSFRNFVVQTYVFFFNNPKKALKDNISLINLLYKNLLSNMLNN